MLKIKGKAYLNLTTIKNIEGGKEMDGILPLWKPKGYTSHDCVMRIRKLYQTKKVGHTGTLDPEVEGVLPICIGQATKVVPFLTDTKKTYVAEVTLGIATDTEDSYGEVIDRAGSVEMPDTPLIKKVLSTFKGEINQTPPMYSAVKVNGKKLYEYARQGIEVERPLRQVTIHDIQFLSKETKKNSFSFRVECSKGTYIRTLAVDIGEALGYPAHMSHLVRNQTGDFQKDECVTFEMIEEVQSLEKREIFLSPLNKGLSHLDVYEVGEPDKKRVQMGQKLPLPVSLPETNPFRVEYKQQLLAIYQIHPTKTDLIKPVRVFLNESR